MMKLYDPQYRNIYLVGTILIACFVFMFISTAAVLNDIGGGKTSADIAIKNAEKDCDRKNGELVQLSENNPLYTACIIEPDKQRN